MFNPLEQATMAGYINQLCLEVEANATNNVIEWRYFYVMDAGDHNYVRLDGCIYDADLSISFNEDEHSFGSPYTPCTDFRENVKNFLKARVFNYELKDTTPIFIHYTEVVECVKKDLE